MRAVQARLASLAPAERDAALCLSLSAYVRDACARPDVAAWLPADLGVPLVRAVEAKLKERHAQWTELSRAFPPEASDPMPPAVEASVRQALATWASTHPTDQARAAAAEVLAVLSELGDQLAEFTKEAGATHGLADVVAAIDLDAPALLKAMPASLLDRHTGTFQRMLLTWWSTLRPGARAGAAAGDDDRDDNDDDVPAANAEDVWREE
jgi:hypothetical protein